jgi:hypothetical protein
VRVDVSDDPGTDDSGIHWHDGDSGWDDISGLSDTAPGPELDLDAKPGVFRLATFSSSDSVRPGEIHAQQHPVSFEQVLIVRTGRIEYVDGLGVGVANSGDVVRFPPGSRYQWTAVTAASVVEFSLRAPRT